jgi:hypothetical protein
MRAAGEPSPFMPRAASGRFPTVPPSDPAARGAAAAPAAPVDGPPAPRPPRPAPAAAEQPPHRRRRAPALVVRVFRAMRRGSPRLAARMAIGHAVMAVLAALTSGALLLAGQALGLWTLGLACLLLAGAGLAYGLLELRPRPRAGVLALVAAQLGALAWACLLIGPRAGLLLLAPAAIWLALRAGGRPAALALAGGASAIFVALVVAAARGAYRPVDPLDLTRQTALDVALALAGTGLTLAILFGTALARQRSDAAAKARLYELRQVRAELASLRERVEEDALALEAALALALRGRGIDPIVADGALSPVAERINEVAERLATLQKDREDRLRLEGTLRSLTRQVERGWLGLAWSWPAPSGTLLDDLVALLRTPRPKDVPAAGRGDGSPSFATLPNAWTAPRPAITGGGPAASDDAGRLPRAVGGWDDLLPR